MPHQNPEREPRNWRLLRLMLLQIAILSIANGCTGGRQDTVRSDPPAQLAPRHRYVEARFVPVDLTESLDRMANRGTDPRKAIFPISPISRTKENEAIEHTGTSRLDTGRLVVETEP